MVEPRDWRHIGHQFGDGYSDVLAAARQFWRIRGLTGPTDEQVPKYILVELLTQDIRVNLRNLTMAASLALKTGAEIVAVTGCDPTWAKVVFPSYDAEALTRLARSYGVCDVVDVASFVALGSDAPPPVIANTQCTYPRRSSFTKRRFTQILDASYARVLKVPQVTAEHRDDPRAQATSEFAKRASRFWEAAFHTLKPLAFITSHVDYAQWAIPVTIAAKVNTPTVHVQSTGGLKAYYGRISSPRRRHSYRRELTRNIGDYFEREVWANRHTLAQPADVVTWRARQNLGVPAWWRRDGEQDRVTMTTQLERLSARSWAATRWGIDPQRPVVIVFNHAVSDALDGNHEAFDSLFHWFSRTAEFAADHAEVTWLFLDHPRQDYYDTTDSFGTLAAQHENATHLLFRPSSDFTKNELWALADLVITTRGSVSNEFPAFGVPAIQAGWSEWSHCGFTMRADTQRQYWRLLRSSLDALTAGRELITPEAILRARLWMWFYRSGADLQTALVPHWHLDNQQRFRNELLFALTQSESDADPLFRQVSTWWDAPTPALMGADAKAVVDGYRRREVLITDPFSTSVDEVRQEFGPGETITSATLDPRVRLLMGWSAGTAVIGRAHSASAALALPIARIEAPVTLTMRMKVDGVTQTWRREHADVEPNQASRCIEISINSQGRCRGTIDAVAEDGDQVVSTLEVSLQPSDVVEGGLVVISLDTASDSVATQPVLGVELQAISLTDSE